MPLGALVWGDWVHIHSACVPRGHWGCGCPRIDFVVLWLEFVLQKEGEADRLHAIIVLIMP